MKTTCKWWSSREAAAPGGTRLPAGAYPSCFLIAPFSRDRGNKHLLLWANKDGDVTGSGWSPKSPENWRRRAPKRWRDDGIEDRWNRNQPGRENIWGNWRVRLNLEEKRCEQLAPKWHLMRGVSWKWWRFHDLMLQIHLKSVPTPHEPQSWAKVGAPGWASLAGWDVLDLVYVSMAGLVPEPKLICVMKRWRKKNLQNQHLLTKTRLFILNIIGRLYYCLMPLVVEMCLWCVRSCFVSDRKPQICLFSEALSFSYFSMNISGSISSASVCCSKEAKEADRKGCTLVFLGWNIYLEVKQVLGGGA